MCLAKKPCLVAWAAEAILIGFDLHGGGLFDFLSIFFEMPKGGCSLFRIEPPLLYWCGMGLAGVKGRWVGGSKWLGAWGRLV